MIGDYGLDNDLLNIKPIKNILLLGKSPVEEASMSVQPAGKAPLHLIIQFPVLNTSGSSEHRKLEIRQKEYIHCLQRNLLSPHVSSFLY